MNDNDKELEELIRKIVREELDNQKVLRENSNNLFDIIKKAVLQYKRNNGSLPW
jgi:hypothetical protein